MPGPGPVPPRSMGQPPVLWGASQAGLAPAGCNFQARWLLARLGPGTHGEEPGGWEDERSRGVSPLHS